MRGDPRRQLLPERESLHLVSVLELVQARFAAANRAAERIHITLAVAEVVAVRQDDLLRGLSPLEPIQTLARHHRVEKDPGGLNVVGVDRQPDSGVDRGPVVDAGEHLADRPVRYELEDEWTDELRPRRAAELDGEASGANEAIERHVKEPS